MAVRAAVAGLGWWGKHIVRRLGGSEVVRITTAVETNPTLPPSLGATLWA